MMTSAIRTMFRNFLDVAYHQISHLEDSDCNCLRQYLEAHRMTLKGRFSSPGIDDSYCSITPHVSGAALPRPTTCACMKAFS